MGPSLESGSSLLLLLVGAQVRCVFDKDFGDHGLCRLATGEKEQKGCAV